MAHFRTLNNIFLKMGWPIFQPETITVRAREDPVSNPGRPHFEQGRTPFRTLDDHFSNQGYSLPFQTRDNLVRDRDDPFSTTKRTSFRSQDYPFRFREESFSNPGWTLFEFVTTPGSTFWNGFNNLEMFSFCWVLYGFLEQRATLEANERPFALSLQ